MKSSYKIPYDLNKTQWDREFQLQNKDGIKIAKRPITLTVITVWVVGALLLMWLLMKTFVSGSLFGAILFSIGWVGLVVLIGSTDDAHRYRFNMVLPYIRFLDSKSKHVTMYRDDSLRKIQNEMGVSQVIDMGLSGNLIHMVDGSVAKLFVVVGSVSALMFDEDKATVVDAYAKFYKSVDENVDFIYDTISATQTVTAQLDVLEGRRSFQGIPELIELYDEDEYYLRSGIGGYVSENASQAEKAAAKEHQFRSSAQRLLVIAPTKDLLNQAESAIYDDYKHRGLMFKYVRALTYHEVEDYYKDFFS